jgi:PAS domain S-box-containing protein
LAGVAVVVVLFVLFARGQRQEALAIWQGRLSAMAADRVAALTRWLTGRQEDARIIAAFPSVQALAAAAEGAPTDGLQPHLAEILGDFIRIRQYTAAALVDRSGAVLAQGDSAPVPEAALEQARRAAAGAADPPQRLVRGASGPLLLTVQPLGARPPHRAVVVLVSNPERWIFPLLAMEPIPTATGESLLVQREDGRLTYASPLRLSSAPPLTLSVVDRRRDPAAWLGTEGKVAFGRYPDYRGVEVLAATHSIPATGWGLVVKVDAREAMAPWRRAVTLGALAGVLALGVLAALLVVFLGRRRVSELAATVAERERYEARLRTLGRLYRTLSEVNQLLVRESDEGRLLPKVCRIVVDEGGFLMAWIGFKDADTGRLRVVAAAGGAAAYLDGITVRWDDTPEGRGPTGTAVRENRPVVNHDTFANPALTPWHDRVGSAGYRSSAAFPIAIGGEVVGALSVYEVEADAFDEERLRLLNELAGDIGYTLGALRERAAREAAERALRESEATFKTLAESAHTAIFVYRGQDFVYVNPEVVRLTGHNADELLGRSVLSVVHPDDLPLVRGNLEARVRGGNPPPRYEFRIVASGGEVRWIDFTAAACEFRGEKAILCTAYEVTERKAAEEERARLAAAIEQSGEAVVLTDPDGTIRYVNPAFTRITGYAAGEAIGRTPRILKSGRHGEAFYRELWATITSGTTWEGRVVNRRKDGTLYTEAMTISAVREPSGRIVQFVAVKRDITAHLEMEEQLLQAQKMEAIGMLAGGVAHDFNNLLQAMIAVVSLARADRADPERAFSRLGELEEQIRRGGALTRQLLLFARRETTRPATFDLNELVRDVTGMLRHIVRENIAFSSSLTPDALPVEADRGQIEQVLVNLVVNASDAMPDGGQIRLSTWGRGEAVGLAVADSGPGVPAAIRERIFEPFFTTKGVGKGTGLGLSVVHGIVTRFGGSVTVESPEGSGATFTVSLPRAGAPLHAPSARPAAPAPEAGRGERILVIEDETAARQALAEIIAALGYAVTAVGSGGEAEALPAEPGFDLLLTDLVLPDVSGLDLAIRLVDRWSAMKLVLMSGYSDNDAVRLAVADGRARFLQKPFAIDTLAQELRDALDE